MEKKVLTIVGARPQFIKAAVVSRAIARVPGVTESMVHTGQHYDQGMSDIFFQELKIPAPAHNLAVGSGSHGAQTGRMLEGIEKVIQEERPDWVLVYGDTNSTLAGALAASKLHIPVAHVEAGLRSFNKAMPEEQNRIVADHLSDLLLTPTSSATENLAREGIKGEKVRFVGDVMYDATLFAKEAVQTEIGKSVTSGKPYILATIHRAENTDDPARLAAIFGGLSEVAQDMEVVLPLHPRTRSLIAKDSHLSAFADQLTVVEPVGYFEMARLEAGAELIATDSGGVQKEAYFHGKPCVILRDETEWVELVSMGWNRLQSPTSGAAVARAIRAAIGQSGQSGATPYGDGHAGEKVIAAMFGKDVTSG